MSSKKQKDNWKSVTIISLLNEALIKKNVVEKSLVLEKTKNHKIYPYLLDGVSEIISYSIKNDLSQTEMISTIDEFLKGIINKSNEINKS